MRLVYASYDLHLLSSMNGRRLQDGVGCAPSACPCGDVGVDWILGWIDISPIDAWHQERAQGGKSDEFCR